MGLSTRWVDVGIGTAFTVIGFGNLVGDHRWGPYTSVVYAVAGVLGAVLVAWTVYRWSSTAGYLVVNTFHLSFFMILAGSVALIPILGFYATMIPAFGSITVLMRRRAAARSVWYVDALFTIGSIAVVFVIFNVLLGLRTPVGLLR
ncbi:MAG: hypothetical protein MI724_09545 [Spirochaetales bacterium]|nr:hypothetical protein [Spirochaetales bacterium]